VTPGRPVRMPSVFLSHGAPPLADDETWTHELAAWSDDLPRPEAVLVVSAHWESAPLTVSATETVPLFYDFFGFPHRYYEVTYPAPGAPDLATSVAKLIGPRVPHPPGPDEGPRPRCLRTACRDVSRCRRAGPPGLDANAGPFGTLRHRPKPCTTPTRRRLDPREWILDAQPARDERGTASQNAPCNSNRTATARPARPYRHRWAAVSDRCG